MYSFRFTHARPRLVTIVLMVLLAAGCQVSGVSPAEERRIASVLAVPIAAPTSAVHFRTVIHSVVDQVKPAVVQVTNEQVVSGASQQGTAIPVGVGSGIIYDTEGHILTNNHVVEGASKLIVSLTDGRSFPAKLIGRDPQTDLAVIQISGSNLPVAELGDSTQMRIGDWVVAIGNALALPGGPTVTAGLVSALDRTLQEPVDSGGQGPFLFDLIQTDAPINPGNSGGPLVNLDAQVIGINTLAIGQTSEGVMAQDVNFAISMVTAKPIADQLVQTGTVIHPYLGADYVPLTASLAAHHGFRASYGIMVTAIAPGSPAEKAGLQPQDVVLDADRRPLNKESSLARIIHERKPGDTLTLTVLRGNAKAMVRVTLGEQLSP
jgi:S1-C subfamily serine protease